MSKNLFIIGPAVLSKKTLLNNLKNKYNLNVLDIEKIFRYLAVCIDKKIDINVDYNRLYDKDEQEKLIQQLYNKNRTITELLNLLQIQEEKMILNGQEIQEEMLYSEKVDIILPIIEKSNFIIKKVFNYINKIVKKTQTNYAIIGDNLDNIDTTQFTVIYVDAKNEIENQKQYKSDVSIYDYIYIDTTPLKEEEIEKVAIEKIKKIEIQKKQFEELQKAKSIPRNEFQWILNPFLEVINQVYLSKKIESILEPIDKSDLQYQVLIKLCLYKIDELFQGNHEYLEKINQAISERDNKQFREFAQKVIEKEIKINKKLIDKEINIQIEKLKKIKQNVNGDIEINNIALQDITYRKVDRKVSEFLAKNYHYLHTPREDEFVSYGAFIEGRILPIAWVSYSKQDRDYKKQLLNYMGIEPQNTIEMTRAWNIDGAPKNIMSSLFNYSIKEVQKEWEKLREQGKVNNKLQAITTTINPNLGFKASAFFGCNFIPFALRPAKFTYGKKGETKEYMTRREIQKQNVDYTENQFNILPLNEMILCMNKEKQREVSRGNIYVIEERSYNKVLEKDKEK